MTDRELLEMAAKAAGIEIEYKPAGTENICGNLKKFRVTAWHGPYLRGTETDWNPLTDDGDRYRLARACKLRIDFQDGRVFGPYEICYSFTPGNVAEEAYAIVRAAAEIGKEMP